MTQMDPRITPARPDLAADVLKGKVDAARFVEGKEMRVSASVLDLRTKPDSNASLGSQLLCGETFMVYETRPDGLVWGQSARDGYVGYVGLAGLSEPCALPNLQVSALLTHVYGKPDMKTKALGQLPFLSQVHAKGEDNGFAALGDERFCPTQHLSQLNPIGEDFIEIAERFLGAPYLWGGRTMMGIDCSGLVQVALQAIGNNAPRDSDMQATLGEAIGEGSELARGDLILWKGHIGIMRDKETLLHANAHAMAVTSEPLSVVIERIEANGYGGVTTRRRL